VADQYDDLSKRVQQRAADAVKKAAAVTTGTVKGVASTFPWWLKTIFIVAAIIFLIGWLDH